MKTIRFFFTIVCLLTINLAFSQYYKEKDLRIVFPNGVQNQAVDVLLGNTFVIGWFEVSISGTHNYSNSVGILRKIICFGANPSNHISYPSTSRVVEADGLIVDNIYIGDIFWDDTIKQYKFTIYHTKSSGNFYSIHLSQSTENINLGVIERATLSDVYINPLQGQRKHSVYYNDKLGIGVKEPKHMLDVNGTVHAKEVKVDMDGWADYVFKKDYALPTLSQVEDHIKEKGHLPNIPNEKEVLENGLSLGENQKILLQKIEELTLYLIEQKKEIRDQNKKIEQLTEEVNTLKLIK